MSGQTLIEIYKGPFKGILKEEKYEEIANSLSGKWYASEVVGVNPDFQEMTADQVKEIMLTIRDEIKNKRCSENIPYTYVQNFDEPKVIKLYKLGGSSCSTAPPKPWWLFSTIPPTAEEAEEIIGAKITGKKGFISKIFG